MNKNPLYKKSTWRAWMCVLKKDIDNENHPLWHNLDRKRKDPKRWMYAAALNVAKAFIAKETRVNYYSCYFCSCCDPCTECKVLQECDNRPFNIKSEEYLDLAIKTYERLYREIIG